MALLPFSGPPASISNIKTLTKTLRSGGWTVLGQTGRPSVQVTPAAPGILSSAILCISPSSATSIRLKFGNSFSGGQGETPNTNQVIYKAVLYRSLTGIAPGRPTPGTLRAAGTPVTFNGAREGMCSGTGILTSDPIAFPIAKGEYWYLYCSTQPVAITPPSAPTLAVASAGNLAAGVYKVSITDCHEGGYESGGSPVASITATTSQMIQVTGPSAGTGLGYRIYCSPNNDSTGPQFLTSSGIVPYGVVGKIIDNVTNSGTSNTTDQRNIPRVQGNATTLFVVLGQGIGGGTAAGNSGTDEGGVNGYEAIETHQTVFSIQMTSGQNSTWLAPYSIEGLKADGVPNCYGINGDSIADATGDQGYGNSQSPGGFIRRALTGQLGLKFDYTIIPLFGTITIAQGGELATQFFNQETSNLRQTACQSVTGIIEEYGTNDLGTYGSAGTLQAIVGVDSNWIAQGKELSRTTLPPRTNTTDGHQTLSGQSFASNIAEGWRRAVNNVIIDTTPASVITNEVPLAGYATGGGPTTNLYAGGDGTATQFATAYPLLEGSETVFVNGVAKVAGTDYTYLLAGNIPLTSSSVYASGVTFSSAPANGAIITITYTKLPGLRVLVQAIKNVFDSASAVEVNGSGVKGTNGGFWGLPVGPTLVTGTLTASTSTVATDSTKTWTQDQYRGYTLMITADATTPASVGQVVCLGNNGTAGTMGNFGVWITTPSVGASYAILQVLCLNDGIHPTTQGHILMAQKIDTTKL